MIPSLEFNWKDFCRGAEQAWAVTGVDPFLQHFFYENDEKVETDGLDSSSSIEKPAFFRQCGIIAKL